MTAEQIKEIADMDIGNYEIDSNGFQAVREAAGTDPLLMIRYAYHYGFQRCQQAERICMNCDFDTLIYELECAIDNLAAVHMIMEEDGGANWQRMCNAVFSTYLRLYHIHDSFNEALSKHFPEQ